MAIEDSLIGVVVGWFLASVSSLYFQDRSLKRHRHEATKERVYSPLFDNIEALLNGLKNNDPEWYPGQWSKITQEQHLSYLIEPAELYESLRKFYDMTYHNVTSQIIGSRKAYEELVKEDLITKVTSAATSVDIGVPKTLPAINEVSRGVGWNLFKGEVWFGDLPNFIQNYNSLLPYSKQLEVSFGAYFELWKTKSKDDKIMVDYRSYREQAVTEANDLRKKLAKKLGKKL